MSDPTKKTAPWLSKPLDFKKSTSNVKLGRRAVSKVGRKAVFFTVMSVTVVSIFSYSIWKVGQDEFSDVDDKGNIRTKI